MVTARKRGTKTSHFTSYKSGFKLPAKTFDTWESSAGIRKQEESGRIEVGEKSGEEHRICPECLSGGIHSALFLLPPPEKGECPWSILILQRLIAKKTYK